MIWPSRRPVARLFGERLLELVVGQQLFGDEELAELTPRKLKGRTLHTLPIGSRSSIVQSFSTSDDHNGSPENLQVVTHKSPAGERVVALQVAQIEVLEGDCLAFCHLRRAGQAGRNAIPIVPALRDLLAHHLRWPGPRADEADVSAEDVEELRHLVEIPGLEQSPARPGQIDASAS